MPEPSSNRRVRAAGIAAIIGFLVLVARFWHPVYGFTAFFQLDASNDEVKLQAFRDLPVYVYRDTGGYDGLYYAQLALDPSLTNPQLPGAMDNFSYRARRILPSAVSWLLGVGRPPGVIGAYSLINVLAWLALAALLWAAVGVNDGRGFLAWSGVLFSAGALCSVRLALTDLSAAALLTGALVAAEAERKRTALLGVAAAALARETSLLGVAGLAKPPWFSVKNGIRLLLALLPLAGWMLYVRWRVGPADQGLGNLTWPVAGLVEKWRASIHALANNDDPILAWTTLLALVGLCVQAAYIALRPCLLDRWWRTGAAYVALMLCLGTAVWEGFPGAATRVLLPLTVAFNVLAARSRARWAWLIAGNLGVLSGLLVMRDVPRHDGELDAVRRGGTACIVHGGAGWYDREQTSRHTWRWAREQGSFQIETWPKTAANLRLNFALRSLTPRTVVLLENGREVWRGAVTEQRTSFTTDIVVRGGRAELAFATSAPPVRENTTPSGRPLGFALYDFSVAVPER